MTPLTAEIFKAEYYARILSGVIDAIRQTDYALKFLMVRDEDFPTSCRQLIEEFQIGGLMVLSWRVHLEHLQDAVQGAPNLPVVVINDYTPKIKTNIVYCNNKEGIRLAIRHLINRGYRKIGMLQAPDEGLDAQNRFQCYRELLVEHGLSFDPSFFRKCDYFFEEDGYLKMMDILHNEKTRPRAMLCFNDDIAIGALKALKESWIKCPEDVAVIGYDGIERGKYVTPPLTTIRQPLERMGREMVRTLLGVFEGKITTPIQKEFAPELVIRQSA